MGIFYVDECGEEGFSDTSSQWLIVGGALQRSNVELANMKSAYDTFKDTYKQSNWHFHFQKATHSTRLGFIHAMRDCGLRAMAVAIYKPSIQRPNNFKRKYYLYFYALRFLLEKATIWCRDHGQYDDLHVYLSTRRGLTIENLHDYLTRVLTSPFVANDRMEWSYLRNKSIFLAPNKDYRGLQVADCVASAIGQALEPSDYGLFEHRYVRDMRPMFHHDSLTYQRAVKVWPSVPFDVYEERLSWLHATSR